MLSCIARRTLMSREEFVEKLKEISDDFGDHIACYDDVPGEMERSEWFDQYVAFLQQKEDI